MRRSSLVVVFCLAAGSAANAVEPELSLGKAAEVPLGEALKVCLVTETPAVTDFYGFDMDAPIRFSFVKAKGSLDAYVFGSRDSAEGAKESLKQVTQIVGVAMKECAATYGVSAEAVLEKMSFRYLYRFRAGSGSKAKPVLVLQNGKFELPN